jgi:hypothetical protein
LTTVSNDLAEALKPNIDLIAGETLAKWISVVVITQEPAEVGGTGCELVELGDEQVAMSLEVVSND